jgi:hypothetical protein
VGKEANMHESKPVCERRTIRQWLSLGLGAAGSLVLVVLLARTAVGAITAQPGPWPIAVLTVLAFAMAMTVWRLDDIDGPAGDLHGRVARLIGAWLTGLLFGLLVARQSTAGVATVTVVAVTWALAGAYFLLYSMTSDVASIAAPVPETASGTAIRSPVSIVPTGEAECGLESSACESDRTDSAVRLTLRRSATAEGESIEIQARLDFAAGAREAVLHVPLWPALAAQPEVEGEPLDADDVELKFTSVERYGIRMEARLASPTAVPRTVLIGIELRAPFSGELTAAA